MTVTLTDADGATATTTSTVVVGDVYAGKVSNLAAGFSDSATNALASNFTATITWGDGNSSPGTVTGSNGAFNVQGSHTYAVDSFDQPGGVYQVTVTITDDDGDTLTTTQSVTVVRPPISLVVGSVEATPGVAFSNVEVANFTVPEVSDTASEFSAAINWGDGTPLDTTGVIVGSAGMYHVLGSHTYTAGGEYTLQVEILQHWQNPIDGANGGGRAGVRNPVGAAITGPRVVAGWSAYRYSVTNPGGRVLSWSLGGGVANTAWLWPTGGGGLAYNSYLSKTQAQNDGYEFGLSPPGPSLTGNYSSVYAYFQNVDATWTIVVTIQPQGGGNQITRSIPIISCHVGITNPVQNGNRNILTTFRAGQVNGLAPTATGGVIIDGANAQRRFKRVFAGSPSRRGYPEIPGQRGIPGMTWGAYVDVSWPGALTVAARTAALGQISVGFVQVVHIDLERVYFPGRELVGSGQGRTNLDARRNLPPWYTGYARNGNQILQINNDNDRARLTFPATTLLRDDTPSIPYPVGFNDTQAIANGVVLQETFTTDVAVMSSDAPDIFWPQARLQWMWNGSGRLVPVPGQPENVNWLPLAIPSSQITAIRILNPQANQWILNTGSNMVFPEPVNLPLAANNTMITWR